MVTVKQQKPAKAPIGRRTDRASAYHVLVGCVGWVLLAILGAHSGGHVDWVAVATFTVLSVGVKGLGFRVVRNVTHSLVGIIDLAALFSLGPFGGALVAAISSGATRAMGDERGLSWAAGHRWEPVLFVSGLNVLKLAAAGWAYRAGGGTVPLAEFAWLDLLPVLAASITLFMVDHFSWAASAYLLEGRAGFLDFVQHILPFSLLVELVPLPLSAAFAAAHHNNLPLFLILGLAILGVSAVLRTLMRSLSRERRHVRELSTLGSLGHGLLNAEMDVRSLCALIAESCLQIVDAPMVALQLQGSAGTPPVAYFRVLGSEVPATDLLESDTYRQAGASRRSVVVPDFAGSALQPLPVGPEARSGLYVPVVRGEELYGVISLQSTVPGAFTPEDRAAVEMLAAQAAMGVHTSRLYQQERQRSAQLLAIAEVSRQVAAIHGLGDLFARTTRLVASTFGYYHVTIFTAVPEERAIQFEAASSSLIQQRGLQAPWGEGLIGTAAERSQTILVNDVTRDALFRSDDALPETLSEMSVPLLADERLVGVLDVQSNERSAFGANDRFVLETLGAQIAIAIEHNRVHQSQQEQAWVSTALQQAAEAIAANPATPEDALDAIARLTRMLAGVDRCVICSWSEDTGAYSALASEGWPPTETALLRAEPFPAGTVPFLDRLRSEGEVICTDCAALVGQVPLALGSLAAAGRVIALPLHVKGHFVGAMLTLQFSATGPPPEYLLTILTGIANHAALGLDNARLYASQREEAWTSTVLLQVANSISTTLDLTDAAATIARLVPMLVGVDWCAILVWDDAHRTVAARYAHGLPEGVVELLLPDADGLADALLDRGEPLVADDIVAAGWLAPGEPGGAAIAGGADPAVRGVGLAVCGAAFTLRARSKRLGLMITGQRADHGYSARSLSILAGIANQAALAIEAAELYAQTLAQQRLEREMELAREIQASFLPDALPTLPGWQVAVAWRAARGVGGDSYDFLPLADGRQGLLIADVSDKGVGAALYMALSRTVIRAAALDASGPAETLERANRALASDNRSAMFVSVFYAVLDPRSGTLCCARAGHNPPIWLRCARGELVPLCPPGTVLGITDAPGIGEQTIVMEPGDAVVMYTDGVTDAVNAQNQEYGEERLTSLLASRCGAQAADLVGDIEQAVTDYSAGQEQFDDFTLVVLRRD